MITDIMDDFEKHKLSSPNLLGSSTISDILGAIVFHDSPSGDPDSTSYDIRLSSSPRNAGTEEMFGGEDLRWKTHLMFPVFQLVGPREPDKKHGGDPGG